MAIIVVPAVAGCSHQSKADLEVQRNFWNRLGPHDKVTLCQQWKTERHYQETVYLADGFPDQAQYEAVIHLLDERCPEVDKSTS